MNGKSFIRTLLLWTAALLPAVFTACGHTPKTVTPRGQIIALSDSILAAGGTDTVRFGRLSSGEVAVKQLLLHNASQKPIVILSCTRTCGCIEFEYDSQPIMPDSTRPARLIFDSGGSDGWQFKLLEVQLAGAAAPLKIYVDAEIE